MRLLLIPTCKQAVCTETKMTKNTLINVNIPIKDLVNSSNPS